MYEFNKISISILILLKKWPNELKSLKACTIHFSHFAHRGKMIGSPFDGQSQASHIFFKETIKLRYEKILSANRKLQSSKITYFGREKKPVLCVSLSPTSQLKFDPGLDLLNSEPVS